MLKTNTLYRDNQPESLYPKSSRSDKWKSIKCIWNKRGEYEGKGVVVIPSDPNTLLERLDLLLASKKAGICDELKRQGHLDTNAHKNLNSIIKK